MLRIEVKEYKQQTAFIIISVGLVTFTQKGCFLSGKPVAVVFFAAGGSGSCWRRPNHLKTALV